jgi:microcystin degradation protein MlrC
MAKSVLLGGLYHETHTFLSTPTGFEDFRVLAWNEGQAVIDNNLGNASPTDGFLDYAMRRGWRIVPTLQIAAMPGGPVREEVVRAFRERFFPVLEARLAELDGIFLILHGAMVSEASDDPEGELLRDIRAVLRKHGRPIPVVGVLDLHANVSQLMIDSSDALVAYRENPHRDARDTALRAAALLERLLDDPRIAQRHLATRYVLPPTGVGSSDDPMKAVLAAARAIEAADPDILNINVMAGYAYADVADCGFSLSCATIGDPARAEAHLRALEQVLVAHIASGYPREASLDEALAWADALPPGQGPILLVEAADNIGGGTPGDATDILGPLLARGRGGIVAAIADAGAVARCVAAGVGATVSLDIGGKTDAHHGAPVPITARIVSLSDGRFELENKNSHLASMLGSHADMGPCAVIANDQATILLSTRKMPPMDLGQFHSQGVRPEDADFVIIKAAVSHRDAYNPIARASSNVDSAGLCTSNLTRLPYRKLVDKIVALP